MFVWQMKFVSRNFHRIIKNFHSKIFSYDCFTMKKFSSILFIDVSRLKTSYGNDDDDVISQKTTTTTEINPKAHWATSLSLVLKRKSKLNLNIYYCDKLLFFCLLLTSFCCYDSFPFCLSLAYDVCIRTGRMRISLSALFCYCVWRKNIERKMWCAHWFVLTLIDRLITLFELWRKKENESFENFRQIKSIAKQIYVDT